ncbi:MAG: bifunctional phosphoribosylaminoimidazolecarboxamide formyltransferase/IMP cyclohydrolase [Elusimicrobia bacterium]|jgi:phosphoribosylaminoimidazolecarboxamide formyltransferase/IMP cyclohydrolase|nr:bifunctional phosphoribosylaminoimidazolecarboxamide formyltransferase/IMP cyclohydrolase [Elusimicrobiota bacterium]
MNKKSIALITVSDKSGLKEFAFKLIKAGYTLLSTGGTQKYLSQSGIEALKVSEYTGFPEILDGRVKTLHPKIHAALLARSDQSKELKEMDIPRIDLVCCNLYPFEETLKQDPAKNDAIIENIDIGGVAIIRAAAKNYKNVITVTSPAQYDDAVKSLSDGSFDEEKRKSYAARAFRLTSGYDRKIDEYFTGSDNDRLNVNLTKTMELRYGENPHQRAALYGDIPFEKLSGDKELSFNNIYDLNAAVNIVKNFTEPAVAIIKHAVPCGAAVADDIESAYRKALESDSMSAFGGIVSLNQPPSAETARKITEHFFEVVAAPDFPKEVLKILKGKKNLRIIKYKPFKQKKDYRKVAGGLLVQDYDSFDMKEWKTVTQKKVTDNQLKDLKFAWKIVRFLRSNAVAIAGNLQTKGLGAGETARVGAVDVAVAKLQQFFPKENEGLVMASDAFFPFPDAVQKAAAAGVSAVIQPGGSKNDAKVIKEADNLGISMILTGRRHFLH